jgi:hypothetical protein
MPAFFPSIVRKSPKKNYQSVLSSINITEMRNNCNFLTLKERSDYVLLKNLFKSHLLSPLPFSGRSKIILCRCYLYSDIPQHLMKDLWSIVVGNYGMTYPNTGFLTICHILVSALKLRRGLLISVATISCILSNISLYVSLYYPLYYFHIDISYSVSHSEKQCNIY